jgi:hypothetical protein
LLVSVSRRSSAVAFDRQTLLHSFQSIRIVRRWFEVRRYPRTFAGDLPQSEPAPSLSCLSVNHGPWYGGPRPRLDSGCRESINALDTGLPKGVDQLLGHCWSAHSKRSPDFYFAIRRGDLKAVFSVPSGAVLGFEAAGVVDAPGPSVSGVQEGDEVASLLAGLGGYGE